MSTDPAAEYEAHRGQLWVAPDPLRWTVFAGGVETSIPVGGAPEDAEARVVVKIGHRSSSAGSILLLWRGERVANIDLSGAAHKDAVTGRSVPTPHYQWIDQQGRSRVIAIDTAAEGIIGLQAALRWFLGRCEIAGRPAWRDPPLQGSFPSITRPKPKRRRQV